MKDRPLPTVVRCRERRQDVAPGEGLVYQHPQRYLRVGALSNGPMMGEVCAGNCAGIDCSTQKHDVLIEDPAGEELLAATFAHDEDGVSALCGALACFDVEVVAIERPDGLLVDRLLETGVRVLALHRNQVKAARERFRASGGKSDRFDRFVLYELARTDSHRFRLLEPDSDATKALRALVQAREDLVGARVALANQLRAELVLAGADHPCPQPPRRLTRPDLPGNSSTNPGRTPETQPSRAASDTGPPSTNSRLIAPPPGSLTTPGPSWMTQDVFRPARRFLQSSSPHPRCR
jgi:hypothetical protein